MRAFIAINLPAYVDDSLLELQNIVPVGRSISPENFHLTLAFLDEQPEELIEQAHYELEQLHVPKFEIKLKSLDTFGGRAPNTLYVAVEKNDALEFLREKVTGALRSAGILLNRTRFRPHVTIVRFGRRLSKADLYRLWEFMSARSSFGSAPFEVNSYSLYRSTLRHNGAVHDELAQYKLAEPILRDQE